MSPASLTSVTLPDIEVVHSTHLSDVGIARVVQEVAVVVGVVAETGAPYETVTVQSAHLYVLLCVHRTEGHVMCVINTPGFFHFVIGIQSLS